MNREDIIEAQTSAVYKMAEEKHGIILEADFLEDMLQTALDSFLDEIEKDEGGRLYNDLLAMRK